jgi:hypothetical protein
VVEGLPSVLKAQGSIPSTIIIGKKIDKEKKKKVE